MAIKSLATPQALIRSLNERLALRIAGSSAGRVNTVRQANDAAGYPGLFLSRDGNEAAGEPVIAIRISQISMVSKDVFGNDALAYTPHIQDIAYELDGVKPEPDQLDIEMVMWEAVRNGVATDIKQIADGTAVTFASMDAAPVALHLDDLYWPNKGV
jgi:hypothetical protein